MTNAPGLHPVAAEAQRRQARRAKGLPLSESFEPADRCNLLIDGAPRTKKNSLVHFGVQSAAFRKYEADALDQLSFAKTLRDQPYNLQATFYVDGYGKNADLLGLLQGLADILQKAKVVSNDRLFRAFDGSRKVESEPKLPRVEIQVTPLEGHLDADSTPRNKLR